MPLVLNKEGQMENLKLILSNNLFCKLFINDFEPNYTNVASSFEEVKKENYNPIELYPNKWSFSFTLDDDPIATYPESTFKFTGIKFDIYGYYIVDEKGVLRWSERFSDGPYSVYRIGDILTLKLNYELVVYNGGLVS